MSTKFEQAIALIDEKNSKDQNQEIIDGVSYPKELVYSRRMTDCLLNFKSDASEALQIAARAQHICRWEIPRKDYPMDKPGYMSWRNELKKMHVGLAGDILKQVGYDEEFIARVQFLISKKSFKKDADSQTLEDVVCLVFLQYYFEDFASKHSDEKLIDIVKKTWNKMSETGHKKALELSYSDKSLNLIKQALA
ncbi:DUF4202 domain-containing protein [Formosa sp. S-31]|uniref:DUF4202 domain-containing protein n=1 Tax=Formosa sp. S-31 TaxID=2790949 RepID=UPI003EBB5B5A